MTRYSLTSAAALCALAIAGTAATGTAFGRDYGAVDIYGPFADGHPSIAGDRDHLTVTPDRNDTIRYETAEWQGYAGYSPNPGYAGFEPFNPYPMGVAEGNPDLSPNAMGYEPPPYSNRTRIYGDFWSRSILPITAR